MGALSANSAFLGTRAPLGNSRAMPPFYGSDTQATARTNGRNAPPVSGKEGKDRLGLQGCNSEVQAGAKKEWLALKTHDLHVP